LRERRTYERSEFVRHHDGRRDRADLCAPWRAIENFPRGRPAQAARRDVTIKNVRVTGARQIGLLISGITNHPVENLTLENIQIECAGGGTATNAQIQLPEKEKAYPEYSMFGKIMPAYGIYARHVRGIIFKNVHNTLKNPDARAAKVFIDVEGVTPANFAPAPTVTTK
jgi:hypothetical protein